MIERKEYLDQLWAWKDEQQIKIVTGIPSKKADR